MIAASIALGVEFVDGFGTGWTRGEPPVSRHHFHAAERCAVARRRREHRFDRCAGELGCDDIGRREVEESRFLFYGCGRIEPRIYRSAEFSRQIVVLLAWIAAGASCQFDGKEIENDSILVGRPHGAVAPQE